MISSTVTLPSYWASALINDDWSGLTEFEAYRCERAVAKLAADGWSVASDVAGSERFTGSYHLYDPESGFFGGDVCDYVILKSE